MADRWTRADKLALVGLLATIVATLAAVLVVPEVRSALGLQEIHGDISASQHKTATAPNQSISAALATIDTSVRTTEVVDRRSADNNSIAAIVNRR